MYFKHNIGLLNIQKKRALNFSIFDLDIENPYTRGGGTRHKQILYEWTPTANIFKWDFSKRPGFLGICIMTSLLTDSREAKKGVN